MIWYLWCFSQVWAIVDPLFPPASAVEGMESVPSVCLSVSALTAETFDIQTRNLVEALTLIISQMSLKVKVIGQRSRSPGWKNMISEVSAGWITQSQFVITPDVMWRHGMTSYDVTWRHGTASWCHGMTSWHPLTTDKEGTSREGASTLRRFHGQCYGSWEPFNS